MGSEMCIRDRYKKIMVSITSTPKTRVSPLLNLLLFSFEWHENRENRGVHSNQFARRPPSRRCQNHRFLLRRTRNALQRDQRRCSSLNNLKPKICLFTHIFQEYNFIKILVRIVFSEYAQLCRIISWESDEILPDLRGLQHRIPVSYTHLTLPTKA